MYLALFNLSEEACEVTQIVAELEFKPVQTITELWTGERINATTDLRAALPPHGAKLYFLRS